jgi:hypothetical protein
MQHYRQQNVPEPMLMRVRNHLVYYAQRRGNIAELEQAVMSQNMPPEALLNLIESKVPAPPGWQGPWPWGSGQARGDAGPPARMMGRPGMGGAPGARPGMAGAPPGAAGGPPPAAPGPAPQVKCAYCGALMPASAATCPSCSAARV